MTDPTWTADDAPVTEEPKKKAPALWKQLLGACGGAAIALGLYAGYQWSTTHLGSMGDLAGYLTPPGWQDMAVPAPEGPRAIHEQRFAEEQAYELQKIASKAAQVAALTTSSTSSTSAATSSAASFAAGALIADASQSSTSSWSSASTRSVRSGSRWSATTEVARAETLPDSGLPIVGLIGAAFGVTGVRFKRRTVKS